MKKIIVLALVIGAFSRGRAQVTVRKDVTAYFNQLPAPPATIQDAYKNCHCVSATGTVQTNGTGVAADLHQSIMADAKSMGTLTNTESQQLEQAKVLQKQAQADNFNKMDKNQQLTWVQNNMQGYGGTSGAAAFAQKLQDPAEQAKFKAMTPDQKLAYMKANGYDPMAVAAAQQKPPAATPVATAEAAQTKMSQDLNNVQAGQYRMTLENLLTPATGTPSSAGSLQGDAQQKLTAMNNAYTSLLTFYRHTDSAFGLALTAANYGYTGDATQDKTVTELSSGQTIILTQLGQLEGYLNRIYQFGASQQAMKLKTGH